MMAGILIVDDSLVARKALEKILTAAGHTIVAEAKNGAEAVREYRRLRPDLVTMDLQMADSDGKQAILEILAEFPDARIIVVSARQDRRIIVDALEWGARHFIAKPFAKERVELVISNVLQQNLDAEQRSVILRSLKASCLSEAEVSQKISARVLIVDDSAVARKSLREIVTDLGYEVAGEAENGSQAFVAYTQLKPDVVTMDLTMQGLGGLEATSKIIAADPKAKIIVISAMEARQAIIEALERGARHFIIKPIKKDKVSLVINNILRQDFNLDEHMARVKKLKDMDLSSSSVPIAKALLPPYRINLEDNRLLHVMISDNLTETSLETLSEEIEEYLGDSIRVLLDFGAMSYLAEPLIKKFGSLIQKVETGNGVVRAISSSENFAKSVTEFKTEDFNYLANVVRVY